jgi:3-dehydroquinate synthase
MSVTVRVQVALGERSYPILIGDDLLGRADSYLPWLTGRQVLIVSNETVGPLYAARVREALAGCDVHELLLPDGEQHKTLDSFATILDALLAHRFSRRATVLALGGGVIGDLAGFAAACYQRGAGFVQVPTTLLAQVDSAVGGKTAVNHARGKNMIGAFYQPRCVVADTGVLATLPAREYAAGLAEVVKYGVIHDAVFFEWLEANVAALRARDASALAWIIRRSCEIKAHVVGLDEREETDIRAILNFGHTFGHAIENTQGYGTWLHGEAVAMGMVLAADLSARMGWLARGDAARVRGLLDALGLPVLPPQGLDGPGFRAAMSLDKKVTDGRIRFILARRLGHVEVTDEVPAPMLDATLAAGTALCAASS